MQRDARAKCLSHVILESFRALLHLSGQSMLTLVVTTPEPFGSANQADSARKSQELELTLQPVDTME